LVGRVGAGRLASGGVPGGADGPEVGSFVGPGTSDDHALEVTLTSEPPRGVESGLVVFKPGMTIEEMERLAIQAALAEVHGNRRKAAELLGIGERTLYRKIAKYDLET
jgi:DNA-binding NtrC family response regulator